MFISDIELDKEIKRLKRELASLHDCHKVVKKQRDDSMRVVAELKTELTYLVGTDMAKDEQLAALRAKNLYLETKHQLYLKMNPSN